MQAARDVDDFRDRPVGRYVVERRFVCWCATPRLWGCVYHGHFQHEDVDRLVVALDAELGPDIPPHVGVADFRRFENSDPGSFERLASYLAEHRAALATRIAQQAVIRPADGPIAALVAGFYDVHPPPYPVRVFADVDACLAWIGAADRAQTFRDIDGLVETQLSGEGLALVRALQEHLSRALVATSLDDAARALGVSTRTLQRQLQASGTSFRAEVLAARIRAAQARILSGDDKLAAIALETGFTSSQHLSVAFRKLTGESPSSFRARHRAPSRD